MTPILQLSSAIHPHSHFPDALDERDIRTDSVYVVYTSIEETLSALRVADGFAKALGVPVTLVHHRAVPYPLPVDAPAGISPIETESFLARLRAEHFHVRIRVHLCRDERRAIPQSIQQPSLVVIGGQRRWWTTRAARRREQLEAAGHLVVFVDSSAARKETVHA